jgi:precorrin-6A/cobalt-precorrin-6A reductase
LGRRVLLATGRQEVAAFAGVSEAWFLVRAIEAPDGPLPPHHEVLLARGPNAQDDERRLLTDQDIDLVVTKDAGGDATRAKLDAARELAIPVLLVRRPPPPPDAPPAGATVAEALAAVDRALAGDGSAGR